VHRRLARMGSVAVAREPVQLVGAGNHRVDEGRRVARVAAGQRARQLPKSPPQLLVLRGTAAPVERGTRRQPRRSCRAGWDLLRTRTPCCRSPCIPARPSRSSRRSRFRLRIQLPGASSSSAGRPSSPRGHAAHDPGRSPVALAGPGGGRAPEDCPANVAEADVCNC